MNEVQQTLVKIEHNLSNDLRYNQGMNREETVELGGNSYRIKLTKRMTMHSSGINVNYYKNGKRIAFGKID